MNEPVETRRNDIIDVGEVAGEVAGEALIDGIFGVAENALGHVGDIIGEVAGSVAIDI